MKKVLTLLLFSISIISYSQDDWIKLERDPYSISYPSTWELNESGQMGTKFIIAAPVQMDGDQFQENINLIVQDVSAHNMDLTDFVNLSEQQIGSIFGPIEKSERVGDMHKLVYKGTMGTMNLKLVQYLSMNGGDAYILTFTAEQKEFDKYETIAIQIMDGFEIN